MIFEALTGSAARGELICPRLCRFHRRRDGVVCIYEIWVDPALRGDGHGRRMVNVAAAGASLVRARCPADLPANEFWRAIGFVWKSARKLPSGRWVHTWERTQCV